MAEWVRIGECVRGDVVKALVSGDLLVLLHTRMPGTSVLNLATGREQLLAEGTEVTVIDLPAILTQHAEMTRLFTDVREDANGAAWEERGRALERAEIAALLNSDAERLTTLPDRLSEEDARRPTDASVAHQLSGHAVGTCSLRIRQRGPAPVLLPADLAAQEIAMLRQLLGEMVGAWDADLRASELGAWTEQVGERTDRAIDAARKHLAKE